MNGFVFIASKAGDAYLARQRHLGGVGGQVASLALCRPARMGGSAWGGTAVDGSVVYVNCDDGEPGNAHYSHITAVQVTKRRPYLRVLWRSTTVRTAGPPIVADGKVWTILLDGEPWSGSARPPDSPRSSWPPGSAPTTSRRRPSRTACFSSPSRGKCWRSSARGASRRPRPRHPEPLRPALEFDRPHP